MKLKKSKILFWVQLIMWVLVLYAGLYNPDPVIFTIGMIALIVCYFLDAYFNKLTIDMLVDEITKDRAQLSVLTKATAANAVYLNKIAQDTGLYAHMKPESVH